MRNALFSGLLLLTGCTRAVSSGECAGVRIADSHGRSVTHRAFRKLAPRDPVPFAQTRCPAGTEMWLAGEDHEVLALCVKPGAPWASVESVVLRTTMGEGDPKLAMSWWTGEATSSAAPLSNGCVPVRAQTTLRERHQIASYMGSLGPLPVRIEGEVALRP